MFKMQMFQLMASNPQMLYFLGQSGGIAEFTDLFGGEGSAITDIINRIQSHPLAGLQSFAQMSPSEQLQQATAGVAQQGPDYITNLYGNAPFDPFGGQGPGAVGYTASRRAR